MNFFDSFGKNAKLLNIYKEFTEGKNKYSSKLKKETQEKRLVILHKYEEDCPNTVIPFMEQFLFEISTFGNIQTCYPYLDKKYIYVSKLDLKYSPKLDARCIATTKEMPLKIQKPLYKSKLFDSGAILYCNSFENKPAVKFVEGKFIEDPSGSKQWWITNYNIIKPEEIDNLVQKEN
jgi:hypothetical protein